MRKALVLVVLLLLPGLAQERMTDKSGFSLMVPEHWLHTRSDDRGLELARDDVHIQIVGFRGTTLEDEVKRLRALEREQESEFKEEKTVTVNEVPCHWMIFFQDDEYRIYYALLAGQRGFLWTVTSRSTDSKAFLEAQQMLESFRVE
ncbi:MAG: hypothetical protein KC910_15790 [Candidatus Eremiobacteraeota bacterium]|nr:hypothetical protein [Candidatus Eremiobacteraeota bacterium]